MIPRFSQLALELTADHFDTRTFQRGVKYAAENRVQLVKQTWPAVAKVRGTHSYVVTVNYNEERGQLWSECSCPVQYACKHAAATALQIFEMLEGDARSNRDQYRAEAASEWLTDIGRYTADSESQRNTKKNNKAQKRVAYVLSGELSDATLELYSTTLLKRGGLGKATLIRRRSYEARDMPSWLSREELRLSISCRAYGERSFYESGMDASKLGEALLQELAGSGMLFWEEVTSVPLAWGPAREESISWQASEHEPDEHYLSVSSGLVMIPGEPSLYVDATTSTIGLLDINVPTKLAARLFEGPPVPTAMLPTAKASLRSLLRSKESEQHPEEQVPASQVMQPGLFVSLEAGAVNIKARAMYGAQRYEMAVWHDASEGEVARDMVAEGRCDSRWTQLMREVPFDAIYRNKEEHAKGVAALLKQIAHEVMPVLMSEGWHCEFAKDVPAKLPLIDAEFVEELQPVSEGHDWFSLGLGVSIGGKTVPLLPILLQAIKKGKIDLGTSPFSAHKDVGVNLELEDGTLVYVSSDRLKRWLRPLIELNLRGLDKKNKLVLPGISALDLAGDLPERYLDSAALQAVRKRLEALVDLKPKNPPKSFTGTLRDYQRQGLAWLHFLHADGYGGLLADDMGLGKTVQLLAFLDGLRTGRKLGKAAPALVVAPRSVVGNWHSEAQRFTPKLGSTVHLGSGRGKELAAILKTPVIITSYQTLLRDIELFMEVPWTTIIFDEAQALKNPATKLRRAVTRLKAKSRFCVTGTPVENHLGELWSQVDLAMPGILGNKNTFSVVFRKPIEKQGDSRALELMRQRIRPFMLRRTKGEVDLDLPEKTEIIERVTLDTEQRDLYESLRLIMDTKVREALKERGVSGSSLIILDALTRLRQCCCDPRLVKTPEARKVKTSAKLERLMDMLEQLADAGRCTLVFSQFTSMLTIIEKRCKEAGIGYVKLTGQTRKREEVIDTFQAGGVPVFLISLKAGGVGLNLTQADTVIHYDPWWNPAAETQATDRAHRIGQTKNVMVYKLVTEATVEEQILVMQKQKQKLTDSALKEGGLTHFGADDLRALFQSL